MRSPLIHFLLVLILGISASVGYGIWYTMVSQKSSQVADLENQIIAANENINRIASAKASLAEISGDEAKVQSYFVSEAGIVTFISGLESRGLAQKATVEVLSVSTSGSVSQPSLVLNLSIKGTFDAVMRTIGSIEYSPYDLTVSTLSVQKDAKNSWNAGIAVVVGSSPAVTKTSASQP